MCSFESGEQICKRTNFQIVVYKIKFFAFCSKFIEYQASETKEKVRATQLFCSNGHYFLAVNASECRTRFPNIYYYYYWKFIFASFIKTVLIANLGCQSTQFVPTSELKGDFIRSNFTAVRRRHRRKTWREFCSHELLNSHFDFLSATCRQSIYSVNQSITPSLRQLLVNCYRILHR